MQTSIINPEVHLTPVKEKKGMVKDANPELVDNLQMGDKNEQQITGVGLLLDVLRSDGDLLVKKRLVRDSMYLLRDSELNILASNTLND